MVASHELGMAPAMLVAPSRPTTTHDSTGRLVDVGYNCVVPRIEPAPPVPGANAVINGLLARVMRRRPDILDAFGRLDAAIRFHGQLPGSLKEAVRRATAEQVGCEYCASLAQGDQARQPVDTRESLAVAFAQLVAEDPKGITDGQFDVLREEFTEEEILELVAFICFVAIAGQTFGAALGLEPASAEEAAAYQAVIALK
jgi:alkylhydroperoxidase/carboxymuconolactone decarboxylase family protein YurZ